MPVVAGVLCAAACAGAAAPEESTAWTWCGWGGGGFFWSCIFDPGNAETIYMGGDVAGLYKTEDGGRHWRFINHGLHDYGVHSLAISRSRPQTLYAMTRDGIAKTENGGADWRPLAATRNKTGLHLSIHRPGSVRALAVDPRDSDTVYAGSGGGLLCKSTDGGETWATLDYRRALPSASRTPSPAAKSGDGCLWMAFAGAADDWKHHGRAEKFLSPEGKDWSGYRRMTAQFLTPADAPKIEAQLVIQTGADWLWQAGPNVAGRPGQWTEVALDLAGLKDLDAVNMIHFVVRSGGAVFRGDLGLDAVRLHPVDGERPVTVLGDWEKPGDLDGWRAGNRSKDAPQIIAIRNSADAPRREDEPIGSVCVSEASPDLVFVAHRTLGVFRSADAGATWQRPETPRTASSVAVFPGDAEIVYGAFDKQGIWKSSDGGVTWGEASSGITNTCALREVTLDPRDPQVVHAIGSIGWKGYYYHSNDGGRSWQCVRHFTRDLAANPTGPEETGSGEYPPGIGAMSKLSNIAVSPSSPNVIFCAANWCNTISMDGGATWADSSRGTDITCVHDIRFCGTNTYVVAMDEGLLVSGDNGSQWRQLTPRKYMAGRSGHQWRVLAWLHGQTECLVSTVSPWPDGRDFPNAVLISADAGRTFTQSSKGLPDYRPKANTMWGQGYARALAADPVDHNILYLGIDGDPEPGKGRTGGGIFKSGDGGRTWEQLPNQPGSRRMFYGLVVDPTEPKRIFWGGCGVGGGVWRSEDAGSSWALVGLKGVWVFNLEATARGTIYAGGNALWRSRDHGQTWKKLLNCEGRTVVGIATDPQDEKRVWISLVTWDGGSDGGVYRTTDDGETWQEITGDLGYRKPVILRYNAQTRELWSGGVGLFRTAQ